MNPEQLNALRAYSNLKLEIKDLETQADELKPIILESMQNEGLEEVTVGELGKIVINRKRNWKYPTEIITAENTLKEEKKKSEQLGTAQYTETVFIKFSGKKQEQEDE